MEHDTRSGDVTQHGQLATLTSVADALACWEALEPASRETWLAELAKAQPRVAAEVESLSRFVRTGDGLEEPAGPLVMAVDAGRMPRVGDAVGEYTLMRVIGAGG
ncbi:MAG TPA: hypothetical protein VK157_07250, partial [Phycisphaerales bacterium]|nr:hypothetical protein [Phycisphaerales bacterium]